MTQRFGLIHRQLQAIEDHSIITIITTTKGRISGYSFKWLLTDDRIQLHFVIMLLYLLLPLWHMP